MYNDRTSQHDVVGLWSDDPKLVAPEPFDVERALAGEPVKLKCGLKAYVKYIMPPEYKGQYPLAGYIINPDGACDVEPYSWTLDGTSSLHVSPHQYDVIGMWK